MNHLRLTGRGSGEAPPPKESLKCWANFKGPSSENMAEPLLLGREII